MTTRAAISSRLPVERMRNIWCCGCTATVTARLTNGREVYPHRRDLHSLPFWKCDTCKNFVGCHHKTKDSTRPLGVIPTPELKTARQHIHRILDPLWKSGRMSRQAVYADLAKRLGIEEYHTAEIRSVDEARAAYQAVMALTAEIQAA